MLRRALVPAAIFFVCSLTYVLMLGDRASSPSVDNHYVHLAQSFLSGQLGVVGNRPPGTNDWALYQGTWFVSFPPFPAVVIAPVVAIWGTNTLDALFWALLAGLAPALLFVCLRALSERGSSHRTLRDNLLLTGLFAFGTVYFFVAVQGTVWFAAHVVACGLLMGFVLASLDAKRPAVAGLLLGLAIMTRPTTLLWGLFFVSETLGRYRRSAPKATEPAPEHPALRAARYVAGTDFRRLLAPWLWFALPLVLVGSLQLWLNYARFDDPLSFGHEYLQIRWRGRIERWGLFGYHYFSKNLAIYLTSLPWISPNAPYLTISRHGLALWLTTPNLLFVLWPKQASARVVGLYCVAVAVTLFNLCYQNSGWIQFGYRFALDYMAALILLLALGGRRFGPGFYFCAAVAIVINTFGAVTFDRVHPFYDTDRTQQRVFQPD